MTYSSHSKEFRRALEAAGLTDQESGLIGRPSLPMEALRPPRLTAIQGKKIHVAYALDGSSRPEVSTTGLLDAFWKIDTDGDIQRFSAKYGCLGLCEHGRPRFHEGRGSENFCLPIWNNRKIDNVRHMVLTEATERWFYYVRVARLLLHTLSEVNRGAAPDLAQWRFLESDKDIGVIVRLARRKQERKSTFERRISGQLMLSQIVEWWLEAADVRLGIDLNFSHITALDHTAGVQIVFRHGITGVFAYLGIQMLSAMVGGSLAICQVGPHIYTAKERRPKRGQRNYCPEHRNVGARDRHRRWLERKRLLSALKQTSRDKKKRKRG